MSWYRFLNGLFTHYYDAPSGSPMASHMTKLLDFGPELELRRIRLRQQLQHHEGRVARAAALFATRPTELNRQRLIRYTADREITHAYLDTLSR